MKKIFLLLSLLIIILRIDVVRAETVNAKTITLTADEWCPYNCFDGAQNKGFLVDIFTHIFNKEGYAVKYSISKSYAQAIVDVREHKFDALIGSTQKEAPDFIFPELPLAYSYDIIITSKDSKWEYTSPKSLTELKLGVVKDYEYDLFIQRHIARYQHDKEMVQVISGNNSLKYNLKKLRLQYINAMIDDQLLIQYYYTKLKQPFPFKIAKLLENYPLYIAFSPANPKSKEYALILSRGLRALIGTEEMRVILAKYGLTEENILHPQSHDSSID
jgi:polar amino acid transport system substrate-binding protein